ncbi:adenosylcobinamide-GDP ribazoletransferase [uncultured Enterovirga sp.]|uniref:adenosylcobinamide-GDP ribazoletransferase n=1 Tax=uncultured Enterovirga sp. TaxID=2026352 RepID=UPI0035CC25F8
MSPRLAPEGRLLAAAFQMLTRLPMPAVSLDDDWLARSAKFFPLVGLLVGALSACVLTGAALLWSGPIPAILAVAAGLLLTGALHEDGLADTFDGFGGRSREARLAIMKDPHLGVFGALALAVTLALKVAALVALAPPLAAAALVAGAAASRFGAVLVMWRTGYAGDRHAAKVLHGSGRPNAREVGVALVLAALPLLLLDLATAACALMGAALFGLVLAWRACRGVGGHTGDVLGAVIAVSEAGFLLGAAAAFGRP